MKEDKDMMARFTGWLKARLPVIRGNRDSFAIGIVAVMMALQVITPVGLDFLLSVAMVLTTLYMVTKD